MTDPFRKLPPRSNITDFSITAYNEMLTMLDWWRHTYRKTGGGAMATLDFNRCVFQCRNDVVEPASSSSSSSSSSAATGTPVDIGRFNAVGIGGPVITDRENLAEFLNKTPLWAAWPDSEVYANKFGIAMQPAKAGEFFRLCVSGVVPARVNVTDPTHTCATLVTDHVEMEYLESVVCGAAQILWFGQVDEASSSSSTSGALYWDSSSSSSSSSSSLGFVPGVRWALIRLGAVGGAGFFYGELDEHLYYDDIEGVTFSIWRWSQFDHAWHDSGLNIEHVFPPFRLRRGAVLKNTPVGIQFVEGHFRVVDFCETHMGWLLGELGTGEVQSVEVMLFEDQISETSSATRGSGAIFTDCRDRFLGVAPGAFLSAGRLVKIDLSSDGYWDVTASYMPARVANDEYGSVDLLCFWTNDTDASS